MTNKRKLMEQIVEEEQKYEKLTKRMINAEYEGNYSEHARLTDICKTSEGRLAAMRECLSPKVDKAQILELMVLHKAFENNSRYSNGVTSGYKTAMKCH